MWNQRQLNAYLLLATVVLNSLLMSLAYPQTALPPSRQYISSASGGVGGDSETHPSPVYDPVKENSRKFAVKPNAIKKVALDDVDNDLSDTQIQEAPIGFSWSNMLSTILNMFFSGGALVPSKSDDIETNGGFAGSPWANVISMGKYSWLFLLSSNVFFFNFFSFFSVFFFVSLQD